MSKRIRLLVTLGLTMMMTVASALPAGAGNATGLQWGDGSTPNHPNLTLVDNTTGGLGWTSVLNDVEQAWDDDYGTAVDVLTLKVGSGGGTGGDVCSLDWSPNVYAYSANEIHFCNDDYTDTGWVGLAITWYNTATGEIVVAQTLMNDYYVQDTDSIWNSPNAKLLVACQEVGHGFGLDHQNGPNKQSCMNRMWGVGEFAFTTANQHDFDQLATIYDGGSGGGGGGGGGGGPCNKPNSPAPQCQRSSTDFGAFTRVVHVIPAAAPSS